MQNKSYGKITAWVVLVATVFVMLFSSIYILEHTNHNCTGNECPVCQVMLQCSNNLKIIGTALTVSVVVCFIAGATHEIVSKDASEVSCNSLISQKVRLNN